jgi:putative flavoprotein involved in K+ transport
MSPTTHTADHRPLDVLVVGAGQAGLALGHHLGRRGARFLLLDAGPEIGHSWRSRWDSLRLFTPAQYDGLPGMPFPAPASYHPTKDEVADYLQAYAARFDLPVRLHSPVTRLHREDDGFAATTPTGTLRAAQVVVATGPFQTPRVPALGRDVDPQVCQLHSAGYRNPGQLPDGARVLVVGAANSGLQIAAELARTHPVTVAIGARPPQLPQRILGRDLFYWLSSTGLMTATSGSRLARRIRARGDLVIGSRISTLRRAGVTFRPRLTGITGRTAGFADGTAAEVDAIVWATGFGPDYGWLHVPGAVVDGQVRHATGVTDVAGLYFLGLPWQSSRGSALLGFVGRDAAALDARMAADAGRSGRAGTGGIRPAAAASGAGTAPGRP